MPVGLNLFFLALLIWPLTSFAKLKIYHCQSESGHIVIQDRACRITDLLTNDNGQNKRINKPDQIAVNRRKPQLNQSDNHQKEFRGNKVHNTEPEKFIQQINSEKWQPQLISGINGWQLTLLMDITAATSNKTDAGIVINFYPDTFKSFGQDAFAQALDFYQMIRNKHQLQDSQFVSHPHFKVFSVSYRVSGVRAYTEYYIAKNRPELWVVTMKTQAKDWPQIWPDFVKVKSVL